MADVLALEALFDAVKARFTAEGPVAANVFGWRQPAQHPVGARIAWIPGDPAGNAGAAIAPRGPGGNPRSLATYEEQFASNTAPCACSATRGIAPCTTTRAVRFRSALRRG